MLRPQGYLTIVGVDAPQVIERDSVTCGHCSAVVFVKPATVNTVYQIPQHDGTWKEEPGAFCRVCMRAVCLHCHDVGTCTPFEKRLALMEAGLR